MEYFDAFVMSAAALLLWQQASYLFAGVAGIPFTKTIQLSDINIKSQKVLYLKRLIILIFIYYF